MIKFKQSKLLIATALTAGCLLSACGSAEESTSPQTVTVTVPAPVTTLSTPIRTELDIEADKQRVVRMEEYIHSSERNELYDAYFTPASVKIAQALEAGEFGPTDKYNEHKLPWSGDVGWGGITTKDDAPASANKAYAWVWFEQDGSIDYARGVLGASITSTNLNLTIQIEAPRASDTPGMDFYRGYLTADDVPTRVAFVPTRDDLDPTSKKPYETSHLRRDDAKILAMLDGFMSSKFGKDWRLN